MTFRDLWLQKFSFFLAKTSAVAVEDAASAARRGTLRGAPHYG